MTNFEAITEALSQAEAFRCLTRKVISKGWLPVHSKRSEEELVSTIIYRIKQDTSYFGEFTDMLHNTEGMDLVARRLKSEY